MRSTLMNQPLHTRSGWYVKMTTQVVGPIEQAPPPASMAPDAHVPAVGCHQFCAAPKTSAPHAAVLPPGL